MGFIDIHTIGSGWARVTNACGAIASGCGDGTDHAQIPHNRTPTFHFHPNLRVDPSPVAGPLPTPLR